MLTVNRQEQTDKPAVCATMHVIAPARLHLGFIDMHGGLGRYFGGLGLGLADICTHVSATISDDMVIQGPSSQRASMFALRMLEYLKAGRGVEITIHDVIPEHAGLGSGTQLALAVGTAVAQVYGTDVEAGIISNLMERGGRSGIGLGAFTLGGFLVDGGRGEKSGVPPIISHLPFPVEWRFILVLDGELHGIHGMRERDAFEKLEPMNERKTEYLCRLTLLQALPALVEKDCERFGAAITEIQQLVGDHFAPAQGGRYCSPAVTEVLPWMLSHGATGIGQSSWGPTGFALFANETQAYQALRHARERWQLAPRLNFKLCRARNEKAEIRVEQSGDNKNFKLKQL
jgi:beta-RFAP synthase